MSTNQYFQKGWVTKRELQDALSGATGGLSSWDPIAEPAKIQAGVYVSPGSFVLLEDYNGSPIDDISSTSKGTIVYFYENTERWGIISAEDKYKGVYQTLVALQTAYPSASNGDYALVSATGTFFAWFSTQWTNTGSGVAPDALRSTNNLSDLVNFAEARNNLDVYSKIQTNTQINNGVFSNINIASNANIETSKIKQTTIIPTIAIPANDDTQDVLNNKFSGNVADLRFKIDNLPVGASSGDTLFLTNTSSAITNYKELSKSPSTSAQVAITTTANNNEVLAASFVNPIQIGKTKLDAGIWQTNLFAYADHSTSCRITARFYKRNIGGTETLLFQVISPQIISVDPLNPDVLSLETPQQEYVVNTTDLVVVKFFVSTTRTSNTNITFYHSGSNFFSHIHTPLVANHNDLKGIQGGTAGEYNHLTDAQITLVNDIVNRIPKVAGATVNNFPAFNSSGNVIDSGKSASSFEPADATILKKANVVNNLISTAIDLPLSAAQGKALQDNKADTSSIAGLAITAVGGAFADTNSIDIVYTSSPQKIEANVKTANSNKVSLSVSPSGVVGDIIAGSLVDADINANANISTSKSKFTDNLDPAETGDIAKDNLLSTIIKKIANLMPVYNNVDGKYLSKNKNWSDLNQNAVGISSKVRKDGSDNIVLSSQTTTDSGTQSDIDIRLGNTTTSATKGGNLNIQASNGTAGSGDILFKTAPAPYLNIEVGTSTNFANSNIQNATFSHTVPADKSNRLLVVSFATAVSSPATAVTYGGIAMTQISTGPIASTSINIQTFFLANPASGTANIVITRANSGSIVANALNISNVNQSTPISNAVETFNNNQTTSASLTLTSTTAGQIAIGVIGVINTTPTLGAGQVAIFNASSGNQERGASSYELVTGSTTAVSYTFANSSFAFHSFVVNQIGTDQLGQIQEIARINSQGIIANTIQRVSTYTTAQTLSLTEDLPTTLIFTSSVSGNSTIRLPNATRLFFGTVYEIYNYNGSTITVNYNDGTQLSQIIGNSQKYQILLTDNSTSNGVWLAGLDLTKGNLATGFSSRKQVFLSPSGSDNNNGFSAEGAVLSLSQALTIAGNTGNQVEILPGTYAGDYTITQQNISIIGSNNEGRGICNFTGTLTTNNLAASSQLLQGLSINNVVNTSTGGLYIKNSTINTSFANSSAGYIEIKDTDMGTATVSITGSGNKNFIGCNGGIYAINNAGAIVNIKDNLTVVSPTLTAGILSISNATIYSLSNVATINAIDVASGGLLYLANVNIIRPDGNPARIRTQGGSFYSFSNVNFDRANSTLSGTNLAREFDFDKIRTSAINGINIDNLTASGNKYKVARLNASENASNYDFAVPSLTTTERDNLTTPATNFIVYNSTVDKLQRYNGTAWVNIISSGTGNVSVNSLTVGIGELALFNSVDGTTLTKVDSTASQRRVLSKTSKLIATYTTAEQNAIADWQTNDIIYNTTESRLLKYTSSATWVDANALIGQYQKFANNNEGFGWLKCIGQNISRTTYANLFIAIGTAFGSGDGSTTFNLPDFRSSVFGDIGQKTILYSFAPANVNTTTEEITLANTNSIYRGTPIVFTTTGTLPSPLVAGTIYYATPTSATTIKVSTTMTLVNSGSFVNLSNTGTGIHTATLSFANRLLGQHFGEEQHLLSQEEMPAHNHSYVRYGTIVDNFGSGFTDNILTGTLNTTTGNAGSNDSHNNMQPTLFAGSTFIFTGV